MEINASGFRNLLVWKEAKVLVILTYKLTENFPRSEDFALKGQMKRASVSVMSQIAEGWIRRTKKGKLLYIEISEGSLMELESQGELPVDLGYWTADEYNKFNNQRSKVAYLLYGYKKKIEQ